MRLLHPDGMQAELAASPPELIRQPYHYGTDEEQILAAMSRASALLIGPGIGKSAEARGLLNALLPELKVPCVIDADALSILAEEKEYRLPQQTILTPHMGEIDASAASKNSSTGSDY